MSKHTPGPWIFNGKYIYAECVGDCYGYQVSIVGHDMTDFPEDKVAANGVLQAAAPDMLKALELVERCGFDDEDASGWGVIHITKEDWIELKFSLAKARGEA